MSEGSRASASEEKPLTGPFRVGDWLAEPAWNRISRDGETAKLEPRVMRLLATLASVPGRPLLREQLLDSVWPDVTVNEEALSRAVSQLRRALGDDPKSPRYVQTVHKGYCLVAPVSDAPPERKARDAPGYRITKQAPLWALAILVVAVLAAGLIYRSSVRSPEAPVLDPLVPITSDPGREIDPAVSPDGTSVAYLASADGGYDLFVRGLDGGAATRLTRSALAKGHPAWSPDGRQIAFVGASGQSASLYVVPANGGAVTKLVDLPSWSYGLDWSPDGRTLAYSDAAPGEAPAIVLLDIATKAARPIARGESTGGDAKPVFSPDGKRLAFIREGPLERQRIAVVELGSDGAAQVITSEPQQIRGIDWSPAGDSLIFSASSGRRHGLWRVAAQPSSAPQHFTVEGGDLFNPSVSRDGRVVVEEVEHDSDIWQTDLAGGRSTPLIQSTSDDYDPVFSPPGDRVAFISRRSGSPQLWVGSTNGPARRLTSIEAAEIRHISWSSDGARLAFAADHGDGSTIHAIDSNGGELRRLFQSAEGSIPVGWAAGGKQLFILAPAGEHWRLEMFDLADGESGAIAAPSLRLAALAPDRASVWALAATSNILLRIVPGEGVVRQYRLPLALGSVVGLLPAGNFVYLVEGAQTGTRIHRLDENSGGVAPAIALPDHGGGTISLHPAGSRVAFTRSRETANDIAWTRL